MPPLPAEIPLATRLNNLTTAHKATLPLITRLAKLPIQPGWSPTDESNARTELSSEIHQNLKEQEEALELLKEEIEDFCNTSNGVSKAGGVGAEKEREKARLRAGAERLGEDLSLSVFDLRDFYLCRH
jgi:protein transport protein SEC20